MLYRIKVVRCIDALVEIGSENELDKLLEEIKELCSANSKIYLHILRDEL
ncbi:hypothetical protein [Staphylothermus marinus]|nr:hypothetical protein [Staphylothermus marinus]